MLGQHMIKSWSTTQSVIALSSGEAEYYSMVKGGSVGLGAEGNVEHTTSLHKAFWVQYDHIMEVVSKDAMFKTAEKHVAKFLQLATNFCDYSIIYEIFC